MTFSGGTDPQGVPGYEEGLDHDRLASQIQRIWDLVHDNGWWTFAEIAEKTHDPENSISAHLRSFRKKKHGGHLMEKRRVPGVDGSKGHWEYRVTDSGKGLLIPAKGAPDEPDEYDDDEREPYAPDKMVCPTCEGAGVISA